MRRCAFLTLADPTGYVIDDELASEPLRDLGWAVEMMPWDRGDVEWERYEIVVIRSAWDWYRKPEAFLCVLEEIDRRGVRLENALSIVRWNISKSYLRELGERGIPIVPTLFRDRLEAGGLAELLGELGTGRAVIKPVIGANAEGAHRIPPRSANDVEEYFADRALMAQPFVRAVVEEGEYSLFFFDGAYSHAVLKTPKAGDFRVQEEHGGHIQAVVASAELRAAAEATLAALIVTPLYARVDLVRANSGGFWLMELELVEPSLYLRMDPGAPERFARALVRRVDGG
jgi:glutathione synthase/RimK-type ligase-like ATP-grasp enzyme